MAIDDRALQESLLAALDGKYWWEAVQNEVEVVWGKLQWITEADMIHIGQCLAMLAYMEGDPLNLDCRTDVQQAYMRQLFSEETIKRHARIMTTDSFVGKVQRNVCTLYNRAPTRIFVPTQEEAPEGPSAQETFVRAYNEMKVDVRIQQAYKSARIMNHMAVRPLFKSNGKLRANILTPAQYRCVESEEFEDEVAEMWIPFEHRNPDGKIERRFKVWTAEEYWYTNHRGEPIDKRTGKVGNLEDVVTPNHYGRIPYSFMRLRDPLSKSAGIYGAGWWELVAMQVWNNVTMLSNDRNHLFNNFSMLVAVNLAIKEEQRFAPGEVLILDDIRKPSNLPGELAEPTLTTLELSGQYMTGEDFRRERIKEKLRNMDLPSFFYEESGQPPTGEALKMMERPLKRITDEDRPALGEFEQDFAELTAIVWNEDRFEFRVKGSEQVAIRKPLQGDLRLPTELPDFSIDFEEEPSHINPREAYELDKQQTEDGIMSPLRFYQTHSGDDTVKTNEEAIAAIQRNRSIWKGEAGTTTIVDQSVPDGGAADALDDTEPINTTRTMEDGKHVGPS